MLLGFMSLILAVTQESISNICIPTRLADIMLPCRKETEAETTTTVEHFTVGVIRNLNFSVAGLYNGSLWTIPRRGLDEDNVDAGAVNSTDKCTVEMRRWKVWEKETQTTEYQAANVPYCCAMDNSIWGCCYANHTRAIAV
ncbi:hypothetical protein HYC85_003082 [Camellia sinensis]|uniref:Uncharacterized protein n=1 Tax=Camellia sinensis TaxID=4442 RepID=A0A7J7IA75_CAMSI|nr:hypothetical protein HYC85_003082 [Camellia sinensis]